jgi:DNA repair exonuclease SbcCD nuclease subunit
MKQPLRFLHTADLQIGMPFGGFGAAKRPLLQRARLDCLEGLAAAVAAAGLATPEFVVIAGDFFDAPTLADDILIEACGRVRALGLPTYVLPGNHDFTASGIYRRPAFVEHCPENLLVLDTELPRLTADGRALLIPAPLHHRHAADDLTSLWTPDLGRNLAPEAFRIGVAHGSVLGFTAADWGGDALNRIDVSCAERARLDYLALGDWHGQKTISPRVHYSGTPEPTHFRGNAQGLALAVEIESRGALPRVTSVPTAKFSWHAHEGLLQGGDDVRQLEDWFDAFPDHFNCVVSLIARGVLTLAESEQLALLLERVRAEAVAAQIDADRVVPVASDEEIDQIAVDGWVRSAIERLRAEARPDAPPGARKESASRALVLFQRIAREGAWAC